MKLFVCGDNRSGQCGARVKRKDVDDFDDDSIATFQEMILDTSSSDVHHVSKIAMSQKQTFLVLRNGTLLTCGENDNGELARNGKRSMLKRVDALETFDLTDAALGEGVFMTLTKDGRMISWGRNEVVCMHI